MTIDFKEIPSAKANGIDGNQDEFELFARDFLELMGYRIIENPSRGVDEQKDLIVEEIRMGISGTTKLKWLVSCKHFAHSGKAVSATDEPDIGDRISQHQCDGFLGVYSTIITSGFSKRLSGNSRKYESVIYDKGEIEKALLSREGGLLLAKRFFYKSIEKFENSGKVPSKIYEGEANILCDVCGKSLLEKPLGLISIYKDNNDTWLKMDFVCRGHCDKMIEHQRLNENYKSGGWIGIEDFKNPTLYLSKILGFIDNLYEDKINQEVKEKIKELLLNTFPFVSRSGTKEELEKAYSILNLPF